jgi:hypothetical protein
MTPKEVFKLYTAALDRGDLGAMAVLVHTTIFMKKRDLTSKDA